MLVLSFKLKMYHVLTVISHWNYFLTGTLFLEGHAAVLNCFQYTN